MSSMHLRLSLLVLVALAGCRGEPVPRDYQNNPPAMTAPVDDRSEAPSEVTGISPSEAQPSTGVEGTSAPYEPARAVNPEDTPAPKTTTSP